MPYDERLQTIHPYAMTREQLRQEAEHINSMLEPGVPNPEMERRLSMIEIAGSMHDRIMSAEPSQVVLSAEVEFSPALMAELTRQKQEHTTHIEWAQQYREAHGITEGDHRDFAAMVEFDEGMTEEDKKARFTQYLDDYYSGDPARRKKCLDSFCDRMDAIDPMKLDLSCLRQPGRTGDGSGRLTASERDLLKLLNRFRNDQTLTVKTDVENPDYYNQRYGTPQAKERLRIQRNILTNSYIPYLAAGLLPYNDLSDTFKSSEELGSPAGALRSQADPDAGTNIWAGMEKQKIDIAAFEGLPYQRILKTELQPDNARQLSSAPISRDENGAFTRESRNRLNRAYGDLVGRSLDDNQQKKVRAELGVRESDMLFIDGRSAYEIYGEKYSKLPLEEQERHISYEVAAAALEGRHRIEVASLHTDSNGAYKTMLSPVEFNMHALDAAEKSKRSFFRRMFDFGPFKIKTAADRQDALSREDPEREERQAQITQKLTAVITQKALAKADLETRTPALEREQRMEAERQKYRSHEADAALRPEEAAMAEARQRVEEADAVNKDLRSRYHEIDATQYKAENYSRAVRKLGEIEGLLESMTGVTDDDKDITHPKFNSLHEALPLDSDKSKSNNLNRIYSTQVMSSLRLFEFAERAREMSKEELSENLQTERTYKHQDPQKIELLEKLVEHSDPEGRQRIRDEYLQKLRGGIREYLTVYKEALDTHPYRELATPDAMAERSRQLTELRGQMQQVPDEVLKAAALREARVYMLKEDHGVLQPEDQPRERTGYVAPQTREEALQRIADIDRQNLEAKPYMEAKERVMKGKSFFNGDPTEARPPHLVRLEIREFLQYMDGLQIDTSALGEKEREAYNGVRKQMETIAEQEPTAPLTIDYAEISGLGNAVVNANAVALDSRQEFVRISKSDSIEKQYFLNSGERARLIRDLAGLERQEEKTKGKMPEAEQEKGKDKTEASKRDRVDLKALTREAAEAGETTSARQRSRSLSSDQTQRQTRERSKSESAAEKPAPQKQDGPKR